LITDAERLLSRVPQVDHKRTFYLLEQLILKYKAHQQTTSVKEVPDGIDFYFLHRNHAVKFQEFLTSVVPCRPKSASEKVLSEDLNNNKVNAKYTFSVEIVPICKDDVLCLHPRQHASNGNMGPLVLCIGVTQSLKLLDPTTMQRGELRQDVYFKNPRSALMTLRQATEYTVIDSELTGLSAGRLQQAELTLARTRDLGSNDERFRALTHLGNLLQARAVESLRVFRLKKRATRGRVSVRRLRVYLCLPWQTAGNCRRACSNSPVLPLLQR
jgi:nonsense-mediated mRNA decay protein 3